MNNKTNWFDFKPEKISGWGYFGRSIVGMIGFILIIPGFWLIASTAYKRAASFNHSKTFNILCSIILPIHFFSDLLVRAIPNEFDEIFFDLAISLGDAYYIFLFIIYIPVAFHIYLLLFNGNKLSLIQIKEKELSEGKITVEEFNSFIDSSSNQFPEIENKTKINPKKTPIWAYVVMGILVLIIGAAKGPPIAYLFVAIVPWVAKKI
tara:strand:+ start:490 stop:1110 length:621 start_codon:yes stop_codon:yes gene_type:complete